MVFWLNETNQMNQINQINKTNETNERNQTNQINKMDQTDQITVRSLMIGPRDDPTRRKEKREQRLVELSDGFVRERHGERQQVSPLDLQDSC